jgi:hypothetical protein
MGKKKVNNTATLTGEPAQELVAPSEQTTDQEVIQEATALARQPIQGESILSVIKDAVASKADVAVMRELLAIRREERADMAREAYANAIVQFRAMCPPIIKTGYNPHLKNTYAQWDTAHEQLRLILGHCGLSITHRIYDEKEWIVVEAVCEHVLGHRETTKLGGAPDRGPGRNELQARKSTVTYLKCATAFALLGLVSRDAVDTTDDGEGGAPSPEPPKPKSQDLLNREQMDIKRQFVATCEKKLKVSPLPKPVLSILFENAQKLRKSQKAADCLEFIQRNDVVIGKDGTVSIVGEVQEGSSEEELSGLDDDAPQPKYQCPKCHATYKVKPANGECLKCLTEVKPITE